MIEVGKAYIWELKQGIPTKLLIKQGDSTLLVDIEDIRHIDHSDLTNHKPNATTKTKKTQKKAQSTGKGPVVDYVKSGNKKYPIFKNILEAYEQVRNEDYKKILTTLHQFYPQSKISSMTVQKSYYERYIKQRGLNPGKTIMSINSNPIQENIVKEIRKQGVNIKPDTIKPIIRKFRPNLAEATLKTYASAYRTYFSKNKRKLKLKSKRQRPKDAAGFSGTYRTWISQDELSLVKRELHKFGFKATTKSIAEDTRLPEQRVRATLRFMIDQDMAYSELDDNLVPVYHPAKNK